METIQTETKKCGKCKEEKDLDSFYVDHQTKSKKSNYCKGCIKNKVADWVKKNPEKVTANRRRWMKNNPEAARAHRIKWDRENPEKKLASTRKWAAKNPEKIKNRNLIYSFGITLSDYEDILKKQNGVCAICHHVSPDGRQLCVDHCHTTGVVRGLLCSPCNTGIGLLKEDLVLLKNAIKYLQV